MSASTEQQLPGAQQHQQSNGKTQRGIGKKRAKRKLGARATQQTRLARPAQPTPEMRLARTVTQPVAKGVTAQTSAFIAFKADFIQSLLAGNIAPTEQQCSAWVGMFKADLDGACQFIAKAA